MSKLLSKEFITDHIKTCEEVINLRGTLEPFILIDNREDKLIYMPILKLNEHIRMFDWLEYAKTFYPRAIGFCVTSFAYMARRKDLSNYKYGLLQKAKDAEKILLITIFTATQTKALFYCLEKRRNKTKLKLLHEKSIEEMGGMVRKMAEFLFGPPLGVV